VISLKGSTIDSPKEDSGKEDGKVQDIFLPTLASSCISTWEAERKILDPKYENAHHLANQDYRGFEIHRQAQGFDR
jgi:hypothetical protein